MQFTADRLEASTANIRNVVLIDTSPIGTVDFRLDTSEKQFLLKVGRAAALRFLYNRNLDDGPSQAEVDAALAACRTEALRLNAESDFVVAGFRLALDRTLIPV
jgi:hypothetical protein